MRLGKNTGSYIFVCKEKEKNMELTFAPKGRIQIDDARIIYRNFAGEKSAYNREGDRNFAVVIDDQEIADALIKEGWNVKIKPPREDGDEPFMFLPVKVSFGKRGPNVYLVSGNSVTTLYEDTIARLDRVSISSVDMDLRPYDWEVNEKTGRTAYLQNMRVHHELDRFAAEFANEEEESVF